MFNKKLIIKFVATKELPTVDYNLKMTIRDAISATLGEEDFSFPAEVSVTLCDNAYIKRVTKTIDLWDGLLIVILVLRVPNGIVDML